MLLEEGVARPLYALWNRQQPDRGMIFAQKPLQEFYGHIAAQVPVTTSATSSSLPCERVLQEKVIEGVVDEFCGSDAMVEFDLEGQFEKRVMSSEQLRENGITCEGQAFRLRISKIERGAHIDVNTRVERIPLSGDLIEESVRLAPDSRRTDSVG